MRTIAYGPHPEQQLDLHIPPGAGPFPAVLLIHGGCFRAQYSRDLNAALAEDLARSGFVALNLEYRRLDAGGGSPESLDDVVAAIDLVPSLDAPIDPGRVALAGHSAGGYLALMAAARAPAGSLRCLVAQAPLTDLPAALRLGSCAGALDRMLAAGAPSPVDAPPALRHLVIHGDTDLHVPVSQSRTYAAVAGCEYHELAGCGHMEHLDPGSEAWQLAKRWLAGTLA